MSQSATLYRVSQDTFKQLDNPNNTQGFDIDSAKSYSIFEGSFMALDYILSKGKDNSTTNLINEIFTPKQALGEEELENMTPEEQFEFYESGLYIPYLDIPIISKLSEFMNSISQANLSSDYDPKELNDNGIYPACWHTDNSSNLAFNEQHLLDDFEELKTIIKEAETEKDYILVFVG
ncbi:DUF1877 family protein [Xanthocytophaga agilis]|uniref:DUF1877 family protein n=1 Tax=Xanthocytophaga agilis TaxID=3048010 RepID=A0AAE3R0V2_9BACT|nr:DUF1877 family protein [Xanthocytophaga agilis]MDJ1499639.1 DUF1877 family protein [Xanthocytophaga agilis]